MLIHETVAPVRGPHYVHGHIAPFKASVREEYLFDMDAAYQGRFVSCDVFCVSCYPGHGPTFQIKTEGGSVFSYLPPTAIVQRGFEEKARASKLVLADLAYRNCPDGPFVLDAFSALAGPLEAYLKLRKRWVSGLYLMTIDWYEGNDLLHLVALKGGEYAFLPNHKINFAGNRDLPKYRKLHSEWRV